MIRRDGAQPLVFRFGGQCGAVRAAGHHQFRAGQPRQRLDRGVDAFARHQPGEHQQPAAAAPAGDWAVRPEAGGVHPAGHHRHRAPRHSQPGQLTHLLPAGRDDLGAVPGDLAFGRDPAGWAGVPGPLVPGLDRAERMEGLHDRYAQPGRAAQAGQAGHPEVRVHHVRRLVLPFPAEPVAELGHVRQQVVFGQGRRGPGGQPAHPGRTGHPDLTIRVRAGQPGVDGDLMAALGQGMSERRHVHVLPARVRAAERCRRVGMFGDQGNSHPRTSCSMSSQSARNRFSPYRAQAASRAARPASRAAAGS